MRMNKLKSINIENLTKETVADIEKKLKAVAYTADITPAVGELAINQTVILYKDALHICKKIALGAYVLTPELFENIENHPVDEAADSEDSLADLRWTIAKLGNELLYKQDEVKLLNSRIDILKKEVDRLENSIF